MFFNFVQQLPSPGPLIFYTLFITSFSTAFEVDVSGTASSLGFSFWWRGGKGTLSFLFFAHCSRLVFRVPLDLTSFDIPIWRAFSQTSNIAIFVLVGDGYIIIIMAQWISSVSTILLQGIFPRWAFSINGELSFWISHHLTHVWHKAQAYQLTIWWLKTADFIIALTKDY